MIVPDALDTVNVDLKTVYDTVVVGSGAAGGAAAHALTQQGLSVILLEAGPKMAVEEEIRSTLAAPNTASNGRRTANISLTNE